MTRLIYPTSVAAAASAWLIAMLSTASALDARTLVTSGNGKGALACMACHGVQGEGQPSAGFPRLSGLNAIYIRRQLDDFADGKRDNAIMGPIAVALAADERQALASFYSAQSVPNAVVPAKTDAAGILRGAGLAAHGDWSKGMPGCNQCHGPEGEGVGGAFPRLAEQNAKYIAQQLKDWQQGKRSNDPLHLMTAVSTKLDDGEIAAVAAYYSSLSLPAAPAASREGTAK